MLKTFSCAATLFGLLLVPALAADPAKVEQAKSTKVCQSCDLAGADLSGANAENAAFVGGDLTGGNLAGGNFTNAQLSGTKLAGANLAGANFSMATFFGAQGIAEADLSGAVFCKTMMETGLTNNEGC